MTATNAPIAAPMPPDARPRHDPAADPALSIAGVSHSYGTRRALIDVSFTVAPASFTALLGLNGAGKSTLFCAGYAAVRYSGRTHQHLRPRHRPCAQRSITAAWRGVPVPHARSRSHGDAEPALSRRPARHRQARGMRAQRRSAGADRACRPRRQQGSRSLGRPDAAAGNRARIAASPAVAVAGRGDRRASTSRPAPTSSATSASWSPSKASACSGRRICSTRSCPATTSWSCIRGGFLRTARSRI